MYMTPFLDKYPIHYHSKYTPPPLLHGFYEDLGDDGTGPVHAAEACTFIIGRWGEGGVGTPHSVSILFGTEHQRPYFWTHPWNVMTHKRESKRKVRLLFVK